MSIDQKKTLHAIIKEQNTTLYNSNMANLASALQACEFAIEDATNEIARLEKLSNDINVFAADESNVMNTTEVKRLFDAVRNKHITKNPRW